MWVMDWERVINDGNADVWKETGGNFRAVIYFVFTTTFVFIGFAYFQRVDALVDTLVWFVFLAIFANFIWIGIVFYSRVFWHANYLRKLAALKKKEPDRDWENFEAIFDQVVRNPFPGRIKSAITGMSAIVVLAAVVYFVFFDRFCGRKVI